MLLETRRKRRRAGGGAAFTVADLPRPPRRTVPRPPQQQPVAPPSSAQERNERAEQEHAPDALTTGSTPTSSIHPRVADRRVLLSRASRMQMLLLERLRCVNLRRARRAELLDEIVRLKKIMQDLQNDIDATTRNLESLEQLVRRLHEISFTGVESATGTRTPTGGPMLLIPPATRLAPGTILWTNPALSSRSETSGAAVTTALLQVERSSQSAKDNVPRSNATGSGAGGGRFGSSNTGG